MYIPERRLEHIDNELKRLNLYLRLHSKHSEGSIDNGIQDPHASVQLLIIIMFNFLFKSWARRKLFMHLYTIIRSVLICYFFENSMIASTALVKENTRAPLFASI